MNLKKIDWAKWSLFIILIIQVAFLCFFNLFHTKDMNDYDASGAYVHIMEISETNSLLPGFYNAATTLDIDSTVWIAAMLYKVTGNIFLSQGICNILIIILYLITLKAIFDNIDFDIKTKLLVSILFFIPYTAGMLGYASMQFLDVAPNTVRNLIPLIYLSIVLDFNNKKNKSLKFSAKCIACCLLMLLTSVSASFYVFAYGVFPIILADIFWVLLSDDIKRIRDTSWITHIAMLAMCIVGMALQKQIGFESRASIQTIITSGQIADNFEQWIIAILRLFGGVPDETVELLSLSGIVYALRFLFGLILIGSIIYHLYFWLKEKETERYIMYGLFVCAVDGFVLNVLGTTAGSGNFETRYHIMPMLFVIVLLGGIADKNWKLQNQLMKKALTFAGICYLALITFLSDLHLYQSTLSLSTADLLTNINAYLEEQGVTTAIIYDEGFYIEGRKIRAYGKKVHYIVLASDYGLAWTTWGGTNRYLDNSDQDGKIAILASEESFEQLNSYYKTDATYLGNEIGIGVYVLPESGFDFETGLVSEKTRLTDFPYTSGYASEVGELQVDGTLLTNGKAGVALYGPYYQGVDGVWNYTLNYEIVNSESDSNAVFQLASGDNLIAETELTSDNQITIENVEISSEMSSIENRVIVPEGMELRIISINMEKVK